MHTRTQVDLVIGIATSFGSLRSAKRYSRERTVQRVGSKFGVEAAPAEVQGQDRFVFSICFEKIAVLKKLRQL